MIARGGKQRQEKRGACPDRRRGAAKTRQRHRASPQFWVERLIPKDRREIVAVTQQAACHDPPSRTRGDHSYEVRRAGSKRDGLARNETITLRIPCP